MRQTRGAIKFLLSQYRAILKHAWIAMLIGTVSVAYADDIQKENWSNVVSGQDYSSYLITGVTGDTLTFWTKKDVIGASDRFDREEFDIGFIEGNYTFGALQTSNENYPDGSITNTDYTDDSYNQSLMNSDLKLKNGTVLTITGNSKTLGSDFGRDSILIGDANGNVGNIVLGGSGYEEQIREFNGGIFTFKFENDIDPNDEPATLIFKGAQGQIGSIDSPFQSIVRVIDGDYNGEIIKSDVVSNGDNNIGKLEVESGSYTVKNGSLTLKDASYVGKVDVSTSSNSSGHIATLTVDGSFNAQGDFSLYKSSLSASSVSLGGSSTTSTITITDSSLSSTLGDVTVKKDIELIGSGSRSSIYSADKLDLSAGTTKLTNADLKAKNDVTISNLMSVPNFCMFSKKIIAS